MSDATTMFRKKVVKPVFPRFEATLINQAWQRPGDRRVVRWAARVGMPKVFNRPTGVATVEAHDRQGSGVMSMRRFLGGKYDVAQHPTEGQKAGSGFALRRNAGWKIESTDLIKISDPGPGVGPRYLREVVLQHHRGKRVCVGVFHFPLPQTGRQDDARAVVRRWVAKRRQIGVPFAYMADINSDHIALRKWLGMHDSWGIPGDVMTIATWGDWGDCEVTVAADAPFGTDHNVLTLHCGSAAQKVRKKNMKRAKNDQWWRKGRKPKRLKNKPVLKDSTQDRSS